MKQGLDYFKSEKYDKALNIFKKEYKNNPSVRLKFLIAQSTANLNKNLEAIPIYLDILAIDQVGPEIELALNGVAGCYKALKQIDSAYFYVDRAIAEFPTSYIGYSNKGMLLFAEGKFVESKKNFENAVTFKPDYWLHYGKLVECCFALEDYGMALKYIAKVKEINPEIKIEFNLAFCYSMLKRHAEADSVFQTIYDEKNPAFLNNYGMNKYNMGKVDEGKKIIMKSLAIKPDNSYAYRNLGVIAVAEKNMDVACQHFKKALELGYEKSYGAEVSELQLKHCK